jgi:hypothetical protein
VIHAIIRYDSNAGFIFIITHHLEIVSLVNSLWLQKYS